MSWSSIPASSTTSRSPGRSTAAGAGQLCWQDTSDHTGAALVENCSQATSPGTATDYEQDDAGNSLGTTADPYGYNDFDQVDQIDGVDQQYRDLGNDLRIGNGDTTMVNSSVGVISRTVGTGLGAETTYYLYDPDGGILASYPSMDDTGYQDEAVYYATNHQKSVFMLLDADGARVGWYRYSPYGDPTIVAQTDSSATDNPWRYLSAYYSPENGGYHHLGARMYDNHGHFSQPDPERGHLAKPLRMNAYAYATGDPCNTSDRNGRSLVDDFVEGLGYFLNSDVGEFLIGYGGACYGGASLGVVAGAGIGTYVFPGVGTGGGTVIGGVFGCTAGVMALGVSDYAWFRKN